MVIANTVRHILRFCNIFDKYGVFLRKTQRGYIQNLQ